MINLYINYPPAFQYYQARAIYMGRQKESDPNTETEPKQTRLMFEGRAKRVYETTEPDIVHIEFKTDFAQDGAEAIEPQKPKCAALISEYIFKYLSSFRIPNHFVKRLKSNALEAHKMDMIPVAVVVRNYAAGSFCDRFGLDEGAELEFPVVELVYKNYQIGYPLVNETHILAFGVSTSDEMRTIQRIATKANAVMRSFMERRGFKLHDMWLEFGRHEGEVLIGDAVYPDTFRLSDMKTGELYDGSLYRLGIGDYHEAYQMLYERLTA
jgi:phosphoribosylaminoimidazole-succinocarboxamide synthase